MRVDEIRRRLAAYRPRLVPDAALPRAAVALVLRSAAEVGDTSVLLIRRAERAADPWSGHVALPGGRREPGDVDLLHTARRETAEEVGLDLAEAEFLGTLDEVEAVARHRPVGLVIRPVVYAWEGPVRLVLDPREVDGAIWLPLSILRDPAARGAYRRELDGATFSYPAFHYRGYTVWGLTYRILMHFSEITAPSEEGG